MSLAKAIETSLCQDGVSAPAVLGAWFPAYIPLTLEATDLGWVQVAGRGEGLLRQSRLDSGGSQVPGEPLVGDQVAVLVRDSPEVMLASPRRTSSGGAHHC